MSGEDDPDFDPGQKDEQRDSDERVQRRNSDSEIGASSPTDGDETFDEKRSEAVGSEENSPSPRQEDSEGLDNSSFRSDEPVPGDLDAPVPQFSVEEPSVLSERALESLVEVEEEFARVPPVRQQDIVEFNPPSLDDSIESTFRGSTSIRVPQIEIEPLPEIEIFDFDSGLVEDTGNIPQRVPQFRTKVIPDPQPYTPLLERPPVEYESIKDVGHHEQIIGKDEPESAEKEAETSSTPSKEASSSGGSIPDEWPDPKELLLGRSGGDISADEPVVVCVDDEAEEDFVEILETLIVRLYREKVGGNPNPIRLTKADGLLDEERWLEAEDNIFTVKFDEGERDELEEEDWETIWRDRVRNQLYAQSFGAIIFNWIPLRSPEAHYPKRIDLSPSTPSQEVQEDLIRLFWGCFSPVGEGDDSTFGQLFNLHGERLVEEKYWGEVEGAEGGLFWDATTPDESAGHHHRRMKVLVVKWLVENLREQLGEDLESHPEIKEKVKTEVKFDTERKNSPKADVVCNMLSGSSKRVFEIETLYGEDRGSVKPRDKIRRAFEKYEGVDNVREINIVLDNLATMLHLRTLSQIRIEDWEKAHGKEVNFYTLNLEDQNIVPIEMIAKKVQDVVDKIDFTDPRIS